MLFRFVLQEGILPFETLFLMLVLGPALNPWRTGTLLIYGRSMKMDVNLSFSFPLVPPHIFSSFSYHQRLCSDFSHHLT